MRCLSVESQIAFHLGYVPDANDRRDVLLLCTRFGIDPPEAYRETGLLGQAASGSAAGSVSIADPVYGSMR